MPVRRLNLKNMYNARDLGGYPAMDGKVTKFGVFIRSELPYQLPEEDIRYLKDYGITACADFRGSWEIFKKESALKNVFSYYHRPIFDDGNPPDFDNMPDMPVKLIDMYTDMVETGRGWAKDMMELAASEEGGLLYHCSAGKDRTGIMSCLLLSIAGVSREDIAADYCITEVLLAPVMERAFPKDQGMTDASEQNVSVPKMDPDEFERSPAETMLALLDYFDTRYGGVLGFLREVGVTEETIERIREKFLEDA